MRIECPFCHTQARLPDSKEGAKVRCGGCGKVYTAREKGATRANRSSTGPIIGVVVVGVVAVLALFLMKSGDSGSGSAREVVEAAEEPPKVTVETHETVEIDLDGWDSVPVRAARALHEAAADGNREALRAALDLTGLPHRSTMSEEGVPSEVELPDADERRAAWDARTAEEREEIVEAALASLLTPGADGSVADWEPYDGEVVSRENGVALVRLSATPRGGGAEKRTIEWHLVRHGEDDWRAASWTEWLTDVERRRLERGYDVVELSDGSVVAEREPEPLEHLEDTPAELRERIDELLVTALDLDLTVEAARAKNELVEIGRPAIPILLTHLWENRLEDRDDGIRANIAVTALRSITGEFFGYQPQTLVGSSLGTTEERRQSSIRQWFAWWYRSADTFTGPPSDDEDPADEGR